MAEYINRDEALERFYKISRLTSSMLNKAGLTELDNVVHLSFIRKFIEDCPSADVAPVVHGKWVKDEDSCHYDYYLTYFDFDCSVCGEVVNDKHGLPNYCPDCGAKMDA